MRTQQSLMLMLAVASTAAFFDYRTDCISECQRRNLSCIISELSPKHFPCDCMDTEDACISRATPVVVCLTPEGQPKGGNQIWQAYWNYTHPVPPHPSPEPDHENSNDFLMIYAAIITTILFMICGSNMLRCIIQTWRRRQYQQMNSNQVPSPGVPPPMPESPYHSTTQAI